MLGKIEGREIKNISFQVGGECQSEEEKAYFRNIPTGAKDEFCGLWFVTSLNKDQVKFREGDSHRVAASSIEVDFRF